MSVIWTLTASFLFGEIVVIFLFLLPFPSAQKWRKVFQFRPFAFVSEYMHFFVLGLGIIFADSVNKLRKCNNELETINTNGQFSNPEYLQMKHLNLFQAQRNFYISGFSLFLWLVLNRLVKLMSSHGKLMTDYEATKKQAISATEAAQKFVDEAQMKEENSVDKKNEKKTEAMVELQNELQEAKKSLEFTNSELNTIRADLEAMKSQAEATKIEYDRLLNELHPVTKDDEAFKEN